MTKIPDFLRTDDPRRKSARFKTVLAIWVAYIAFLVGTYSTRFTWSGNGWLATTFGFVAPGIGTRHFDPRHLENAGRAAVKRPQARKSMAVPTARLASGGLQMDQRTRKPAAVALMASNLGILLGRDVIFSGSGWANAALALFLTIGAGSLLFLIR